MAYKFVKPMRKGIIILFICLILFSFNVYADSLNDTAIEMWVEMKTPYNELDRTGNYTTIDNGVTYTTDRGYFDGTDDISTNLNPGDLTDKLFMGCWVYTSSWASGAIFVSGTAGGSIRTGFWNDGAGNIDFRLGADANYIQDVGEPSTNAWHFIGMRYNGSQLDCWIDKALTTLGATTGNMGVQDFDFRVGDSIGVDFTGNITNCFISIEAEKINQATIDEIVDNGYDHTYNDWFNTTPTITNFSINLKDLYNNSDIKKASVFISNSTYNTTINTTNGVFSLGIYDGFYNLSFFNASNYFDRKYINYDVSTNLNAKLIPKMVILNITYGNYLEYSNLNYTRNLTYSINFICPSDEITKYYLMINGIINNSVALSCNNLSSVKTGSYQHLAENKLNISFIINSSSRTEKPKGNTTFQYDLNNPSQVIPGITNINIVNNTQANISLFCNDTVSPILTYGLTFNGNLINYDNYTTTRNISNISTLTNGNNRVIGNCSDFFGYSDNTLNTGFYSGNITIIDESDGTFFNVSNISGVRLIYENGTIFDFQVANTYTTSFSTDQENAKIKVELEYSTGEIISRYIDWTLVNGTANICANVESTTYAEQFIVSSTETAVLMENTFYGCLIGADYTRFAYQDALILRAFTIESLYLLKTFTGGQFTLLASIDGGVASSINIDTLEFNSQGYNINVLGESLSFYKTGAGTIQIYYESLEGIKPNLNLVITNADTNAQYLDTNIVNKNNFTLFFDYSTLGLNNNSLLELELTITEDDGTETVLTRYFDIMANDSVIDESIAIGISLLLMIFGLTFTASRITFSWFGIVIEIMSIAILSLGGYSEWYSKFFLATYMIVMIYTILIMINKNYPTVA